MSDTMTLDNAIAAALTQNWQQAIKINTALLKTDEENIDALNRLGFAYLKNGQLLQAKRCFAKVIKLDEYNQIALKNIDKLNSGKANQGAKCMGTIMSPLMFLEEPGKTKIAVCVNPAPARTLSSLVCGQEVLMKPKKHCVEIRDRSDTYIGALPDDLSFKLIKYMSAGNIYQAAVKGIGKNSVTIFLRELSRGKKFANQPSFIAPSPYIPFNRNEGEGGGKPDVTPTGEESEDAPVEEEHRPVI